VRLPGPSPWPLALRVFERGPDGQPRLIGELGNPRAPEASLPAHDRWFVEPADPDAAAPVIDRLGHALRERQVPGLSLRVAAGIDGAALARLGPLPRMRMLDLSRTAVSDAGVTALTRAAPQLRALYLDRTAIGDAGARALSALGELEVLGLERTQVSDAGLASLGALTKLTDVLLAGTRIRTQARPTWRRCPR
jgi:hypothetical protein